MIAVPNTTHLEVEGRHFVEIADDMHHHMVLASQADPQDRGYSVEEGMVVDLRNQGKHRVSVSHRTV